MAWVTCQHAVNEGHRQVRITITISSIFFAYEIVMVTVQLEKRIRLCSFICVMKESHGVMNA